MTKFAAKAQRPNELRPLASGESGDFSLDFRVTMRVVYDYGIAGGGRNRYAPRVDTPGESSAQEAARRGRSNETVVIISREAGGTGVPEPGSAPRPAIPGEEADRDALGRELTDESKARLREHSHSVRLHEQAHMAALGGHAAGAVQYTENRAPDGSSYITGGRIKVDLSPVPGDPKATLRKARTIQRAALAPGDSSPADMATAAKAYRLQMEAMREIREGEA
jgi:hypothetical protein